MTAGGRHGVLAVALVLATIAFALSALDLLGVMDLPRIIPALLFLAAVGMAIATSRR